MDVPEKVAKIQSYLSVKSKYDDQFKLVSRLSKQLTQATCELEGLEKQTAEQLSQVDDSMLITKQSLPTINDLLSQVVSVCSGKDNLPVGCAVLQLEKGKCRLVVAFSQPVFSAWRTETPYKSWQMCSLRPDTPDPPSENHIPEYKEVIEQNSDLSCWERVDGELRFWLQSGSQAVVFKLLG